MRAEFHADLEEVSLLLVAMADEVRSAMKRATNALLAADKGVAEGVITGDVVVNQLHREVEDKVYALLARQAPVASDLRLVMSALHVAADFERMGDLAKHVAKTAIRRHPNPAVPSELVPVIRDMAAVADRIAGKISKVVASPGRGQRGRAGARRRRHGRPAQGPVRGAARRGLAQRRRVAPSTARCSAASTSATPTTRSTPATACTSWSPARSWPTRPRRRRDRPDPDGPVGLRPPVPHRAVLRLRPHLRA